MHSGPGCEMRDPANTTVTLVGVQSSYRHIDPQAIMPKYLRRRGTRQTRLNDLHMAMADVTATDIAPSPGDARPRVLFVNTRSTLGADVAVHLTLVEHLNPDAVDVYVATNRHSADLDKTVGWIRKAPQAQLLVCDLGHELTGGNRVTKALSVVRNLPAFFTLLRLIRFIRRERITILHTTDRPRDAAFTTLLGKLTGASVVLHLHLKWTSDIGRAAHWAARHARAFIGISKFTCQSMVDGGLPAERIAMVYNASDTTRFNPETVHGGTLRSRLGIDDRVPLVGLVGRFTVWKGHLDLVTAFARVREMIPAARLVLVGRLSDDDMEGEDSYVSKIKRRISDLGLTDAVHWVEWASDTPGVMKDLDVLAMPSWEEPFGLVVTEAMAMERPVVAYASGALPEIITDGVDGLLVPPRDTEALALALVSLLRDPERRTAMGKRGRQRVVTDFGPQRQADEVAALYRVVARDSEPPRPTGISALAPTN